MDSYSPTGPANAAKIGRVFNILAKNLLLCPFNWRSSRRFASYLYAYHPIPAANSEHGSPRLPLPLKNATTVYDLFPEAAQASILLSRLKFEDYGNVNHEELCVLALIAKCHLPKTIFEIGTFDGTTTLQMALNSSDDTRVFTLNLPPQPMETKYGLGSDARDLALPFAVTSGRKFKDTSAGSKIKQLFGDSATYDYSPYHGQIDLVFVDAAHSYDYVKNDTEQAIRMLSARGMVVWHDYPRAKGVAQYIDELATQIPICHIAETNLAVYRK